MCVVNKPNIRLQNVVSPHTYIYDICYIYTFAYNLTYVGGVIRIIKCTPLLDLLW